MINKEDKVKLFLNEINYIKDSKLKEFATKLIENADDYFFSVPASSSGKYHPQFDLGDGGLVRHTRCVAFFAKTMAESMDFNEHDTDLIIIAALAHDIRKQGNNTGHTVREHPLLGAEYVKEIASNESGLISDEDVQKIMGAVQSHMGRWEHRKPWLRDGNEPYPMPSNDFEKALQSADYVASRKEILSFEFAPTEEVEIIKEEKKLPENLKDYVLQFGKHKGKTLEEIEPTGYLAWVVKQEDFFNKEAQDIIRQYLGERKGKETKSSYKSVPTPTFETLKQTVEDMPMEFEPDDMPF